MEMFVDASGAPTVVLTVVGELDREELARIREDLSDLVAGGLRRVVILLGSAKGASDGIEHLRVTCNQVRQTGGHVSLVEGGSDERGGRGRTEAMLLAASCVAPCDWGEGGASSDVSVPDLSAEGYHT